LTRIVTIRELPSTGPAVHAAVHVSAGAVYSTTVSAPITSEEQSLVTWYFGEWLASQFGESGRAMLAEEALKRCGERLFQSVFGSEYGRQAWASLRERENEDAEIRIEISGSSAFQRLPWEWMRTPGVEEPVALVADIVRTGRESGIHNHAVAADVLNVLIVRSRSHKVDVNPAVVARPLLRTARSVNVPIRVHVLRPSTLEGLRDHLRETERRHGLGHYHIIHFDVHGSLRRLQSDGDMRSTMYTYLELEAPKNGGPANIDASELARIVEPHGTGMVVLTACESAKHDPDGSMSAFAEALFDAGIPCVLGMADAISTTAVEYFVQFFYLALTFEGDPQLALRLARKGLHASNVRGTAFDTGRVIQDWMLPVLYVRTAPRFILPQTDRRPFDDPQIMVQYAKGDPIGRDLDATNLERLLLAGRSVILVVAGPGVGRTTFLRHLGWFWSMTGFVEPDHVERLGLSGERYSADDVTRTLAERGSKSQRLILIDDVDQLGIENPADLLHAAAETGAWVIATTRRLTMDLPRWLDDVYVLPPIDLIKAAELTYVLLFGHKVQTDTPAFHALSDWIGGLPLAIKGVVPELATRTSTQLLDEVETGALNIDRPEPQVGTRSLRGSIDCALAALSPLSRSLVVYLAPFGPEVSSGLLAEYEESLRDHAPELVDGFDGLISELVMTSLAVLRPDSSNESVRINPLLTIYLRHVLRQPVLETLRATINSAFLRAVSRRARTLVSQEIAGSIEAQKFARQLYVPDRFAYRHALRVGVERHEVAAHVYVAAAQGFFAVDRPAEAVRLGEMVADALAASKLPMSYGVAQVLHELAKRHLAHGNVARTRDLLALIRSQWSEVDDRDRWLFGSLLLLEAELALRDDRTTDAEALVRRVLDLSESDTCVRDLLPTRLLLATTLFAQKQFAEAERYAHEVLKTLDDPDNLLKGDALHLVGLCAFETGRLQESIEAFSNATLTYRLTAANDRAAISHGVLARSYHVSGMLDDAHDNYIMALRLATPLLGGGVVAQMHQGFGLLLRAMGRARDAEQHFEEATRAWAREGKAERAAAAFERALDSRVDREPWARIARSLLWARRAEGLMQTGDAVGAIALLRSAVAEIDLTLGTMNDTSGPTIIKATLFERLTALRILVNDEQHPEVALRKVLSLYDEAVGEASEFVTLAQRARARKVLGLWIAGRDPQEAASLIETSKREIARLRAAGDADAHLRSALSAYDSLEEPQ
jgi:tetratricopeptide (TPR) repeat protein